MKNQFLDPAQEHLDIGPGVTGEMHACRPRVTTAAEDRGDRRDIHVLFQAAHAHAPALLVLILVQDDRDP
jgi:hypothetical protein